jgi:hypothetical protein
VYAPQWMPTTLTFLRRTRLSGSCSILPAAKPTTTARPFHAMHFMQSARASAPAHTESGGRTLDHADGVVDDVDAAPAGELQHLLLPARLRVVDGVVRAAVRF